ncbi:MAG: B12-binding domain-containing radical SAM protein [Planctomycetes bacterium]|nr:B12-binding domain-containing radical SAM protein [Planctomycetota bacterium]
MSRKKVILFFPRTGWDTEGVNLSLPLPLMYVAVPLERAGYVPHIIDQRINPQWREELRREIQGGDVLAFAVSTMTGRQLLGAREASKLVKQLDATIPVMWGGVHPTLLPEQTIQNDFVDAVCVGEGEEVFTDWVKAVDTDAPWDDIPGITFRRAGEVHLHKKLPPTLDLNQHIRPAYHLVDMKRYITTRLFGERDFILMMSRGCPHQCTYCYETAFNINNQWRAVDPKLAVDEIEYVKKTYGITAVTFMDDLYYGKKKWADAMAEEIIHRKLNMTFRADIRVDYATGFGVEYMKKQSKAGFKYMFVGVESGSDRILKFIKKQITREKILESAQVFHEAGVSPHCSFMAGYPTETMDEVMQTLSLMLEVTAICPNATTSNLQIYAPYPGTELFTWCLEHGMKLPATIDEWSSSNFNRVNEHVWIGDKDQNFLRKASYFTYFLDGNTVANYFRDKPAQKAVARLYSRVVRARVRRHFYSFMPEMSVVAALKERDII